MPKAKLKEQKQALEMAAQGMSAVEIGQRLGVHKVTVKAWLNPELADSRRRNSRLSHSRKRGACRDCGKETRYSGYKTNRKWVSERCQSCANKETASARKGQGPVQVEFREFLKERGEARYIDIARSLGISNNQCSNLIHRELASARIQRVRRGIYALC